MTNTPSAAPGSSDAIPQRTAGIIQQKGQMRKMRTGCSTCSRESRKAYNRRRKETRPAHQACLTRAAEKALQTAADLVYEETPFPALLLGCPVCEPGGMREPLYCQVSCCLTDKPCPCIFRSAGCRGLAQVKRAAKPCSLTSGGRTGVKRSHGRICQKQHNGKCCRG